MISITVVLLWLSLRGLTGEENKGQMLWAAWERADKFYLSVMAVILIFSHLVRAQRWRLLLAPANYHVGLGSSFLSVLIAYLVNLAIPRGGEVSRCYNLFKLENTPVEVSFGTVVVERIVDLICLLILVVLSFIIEWSKLEGFIATLDIGGGEREGFRVSPIMIAILVGIVGLVVVIFFFRKNQKLRKLWLGFKEGLLTVFRMKNKTMFIAQSVTIWILYFLMTYVVMLSFDETAALGPRAVLTIFAIGGIAMAAPLPGGAGSYHVLLPMGLAYLYGMKESHSVPFVFIFHAWQTIVLIVAGVVSLIISYWIIRWKKPQTK
jgi:uncharacterized membrane protein YbhN (UPF0104 family)